MRNLTFRKIGQLFKDDTVKGSRNGKWDGDKKGRRKKRERMNMGCHIKYGSLYILLILAS